MSSQIRTADTLDVAGIFHVRTTVSETISSMVELSNIGITETSITKMIASHQCACVAAQDDDVIDFSMIDVDEGSQFAAFVLPSHQGQSVGRGLVEAAEAAPFACHAVCWLETESRALAAGYYRRLGWTHEQNIGNGDIRLEKRLA